MVDLSLEHPKSGGMAAAALLKTKQASPKGTVYLSQQKGGPKLPVSIGHAAAKESSKIISSSLIASIQKEQGLSNNQTEGMIIQLNTARPDGKKIVETGTREKLAKRVHDLSELHAKSEITVEGQTYPVSHITNLDALIDHVLDKRGLKLSDVIVRLSLDSGQGSLKLSMNVIDLVTRDTLLQFGKKTRKTRKTRRLGEFKDSGVQKILILAEVEDLDESHEAFHKLFDLINVGEHPFTNACDFKAGNILAGISTATDHRMHSSTTWGTTLSVGCLTEEDDEPSGVAAHS